MGFLSILFQHKEFIGIIILMLMMGGFYGYIKILKSENESLKEKNSSLQISLDVSNKSIKDLQTSIAEQNTAIDKLKADSDARAQSQAVEIAAAVSKADTYRKQALDIIKLKPQDPNRCNSANDLINKEIQRNGKN